MRFSSLGILLTKKCTAECDICCFSCSPEINEKMSLEDAKDYIKQAAEIESFSTVGVSGGEPFLYFDELLEIIKTARLYKLKVTCATNGFWAKTEEIASQR